MLEANITYRDNEYKVLFNGDKLYKTDKWEIIGDEIFKNELLNELSGIELYRGKFFDQTLEETTGIDLFYSLNNLSEDFNFLNSEDFNLDINEYYYDAFDEKEFNMMLP